MKLLNLTNLPIAFSTICLLLVNSAFARRTGPITLETAKTAAAEKCYFAAGFTIKKGTPLRTVIILQGAGRTDNAPMNKDLLCLYDGSIEMDDGSQKTGCVIGTYDVFEDEYGELIDGHHDKSKFIREGEKCSAEIAKDLLFSVKTRDPAKIDSLIWDGTNISLYLLAHTVKEAKYGMPMAVYVDKPKIESEFKAKVQSKYYKWK